MSKLIEEDVYFFAQRAQMYYKKRSQTQEFVSGRLEDPLSPLKHHPLEKLMSSVNDNYDSYYESCDVGESGEFEIDDPEQKEDEGSKFDNCVEPEEIQFVVANDVMEIERLGEENKDNKGSEQA
ncbi:protein NETWORKED 3A-like [Vigna umbellata]|uniref:protein NETWORKED 3A-like n=1 Tax=Vigna umbellata TaxID=87088 RepID=UPI001F5E65A5|nr:protein NETWORKED 3A-like [Vigna umbellata]